MKFDDGAGGVSLGYHDNIVLPLRIVAKNVKYFNAATSTGRGAMNIDATVANSPANVLAGSFTSTVTVAISSGP